MEYPKKPRWQHAVAVSRQPSTRGFYYDFDQKRYRPCQAFNWQPYDLAIWRYTDTDDEGDTFVTGKDSYRMIIPTPDRSLADIAHFVNQPRISDDEIRCRYAISAAAFFALIAIMISSWSTAVVTFGVSFLIYFELIYFQDGPHSLHQSMLKEKQWREQLYLDGLKQNDKSIPEADRPVVEFDFMVGYKADSSDKNETEDELKHESSESSEDNLNDESSEENKPLTEVWRQAGIAWVKADIVPGVLLIGSRDHPNVSISGSGFGGYYFIESTRIQPLSSHTDIITEEQRAKEKQEKLEREQRYQATQDKIAKIKETLPLYRPKKYGENAGMLFGPKNANFYDTLPYYQSLKKYPEEITLDWCLERAKENDDFTTKLNDQQKEFIGLMGLNLLRENKYEVCYDTVESKTMLNYAGKPIVYLNKADAYFNIKVHNATYARLHSGDGDPNDEFKRVFEMEKVGETFTLSDLTYDNPLFGSGTGAVLIIYTDGDRVSYNRVWIDMDPRRILIGGVGNSWAVTHFPSFNRILLTGHVWMPSESHSYDDLIRLN